MLMLKGDNYKSVVLNELMRNKFNECIIWDEPTVNNLESAWIADNNELNYLCKCIIELNDSLGAAMEDRDLLLIYTNKMEEEIKSLIEWIKEEEKYLLFKQVLVTCR